MELLQSRTVHLLLLVSTRLTGLLLVAPVFSSRVLSVRLRAALLLLLSVVLLPAAGAGGGAGWVRATPTALATEAVVGIVLGLGAALFVAAAESAGDMLAVQMGLSGANVLDPSSATQLPVVGQFLGLFVVALLVATGGHLEMLEALAASFRALPPGADLQTREGLMAAVRLGSVQLFLGLRFAAPVVAAMMIGNTALGILARTVPQLNVLLMAFPLQIGIGLLTLALTLPLLAAFFGGWAGRYEGVVSGALEALLPAGGGP